MFLATSVFYLLLLEVIAVTGNGNEQDIEDYSTVANNLKVFGENILSKLLRENVCMEQKVQNLRMQNQQQRLCQTARKLLNIIDSIGTKTLHQDVEPISKEVYKAIMEDILALEVELFASMSYDEKKNAENEFLESDILDLEPGMEQAERREIERAKMREFNAKRINEFTKSLTKHGDDVNFKNKQILALKMVRSACWMHFISKRVGPEIIYLAMLRFASNLLVYSVELEQPALVSLFTDVIMVKENEHDTHEDSLNMVKDLAIFEQKIVIPVNEMCEKEEEDITGADYQPQHHLGSLDRQEPQLCKLVTQLQTMNRPIQQMATNMFFTMFMHKGPKEMYFFLRQNSGSFALRNSSKLNVKSAEYKKVEMEIMEQERKLAGEKEENKVRQMIKLYYEKSVIEVKNAVLEGEKGNEKSLWIKAHKMFHAAEWMYNNFNRSDRERLTLALLDFAANLLVYGIERPPRPELLVAKLANDWFTENINSF